MGGRACGARSVPARSCPCFGGCSGRQKPVPLCSQPLVQGTPASSLTMVEPTSSSFPFWCLYRAFSRSRTKCFT